MNKKPEGEQPKRVKSLTEQQKLQQKPWYPQPYPLADVEAIQALDKGIASQEQQKRALNVIIELCGYYDLSYRPGGEEGRRDTDFAEGKRFVGAQIVKFTKINLAAMRRLETSDLHEPKS